MTSRHSFLMVGRLVALALLGLCEGTGLAGTINVPADYGSIQAAIDAANDGDEVVVAPNTYYENIDFKGKAITVRSTDPDDPAVVAATIIDGQEKGSVVTFRSGEGPGSVLRGLTLTNGTSWRGGGVRCRRTSPTITGNTISGNSADSRGGGIYCHEASPAITGNTISGNSARPGSGGGIYCRGGSPRIDRNTMDGNSAGGDGGGVTCYNASPSITGNTISSNSAGSRGGGVFCRLGKGRITGNTISGNSAWSCGGIFCYWASPAITGNTITGNSTDRSGGGIYCHEASPAITGNTISGNSASEDGGGISCWNSRATITTTIVAFSDSGGGIHAAGTRQPAVSYCDVYRNADGNYLGFTPSGPGNISRNPLFVDAAGGDFHLKSRKGRWDPVSQAWVYDAQHSPCIDRGDPSADWSNEPLPNGGRVNIGAYGNTDQASKGLGCTPLLLWLGTTGFVSEGVDPDNGGGGDTRFRFRVQYTDAHGNPPRYVSLHLRRNGKPFREFAMVRGVGDYTEGRVYRRTRKLPPGNYEHCFKARDRDGLATGEATVWTPGPVVGPRTAVALTSLCAVPTNAGTQITFSLSAAAQVQARVLNIAGRPVRTLCHAQDCQAGTNTLLWNAHSDNGLALPNGTYLVEVTAKAADGSQASALGQVRVSR